MTSFQYLLSRQLELLHILDSKSILWYAVFCSYYNVLEQSRLLFYEERYDQVSDDEESVSPRSVIVLQHPVQH